MSIREITEDEIRAYEEDGVVFLKGLFDAEWVEKLRDGVEQFLDNPGEISNLISGKDDPGKFVSGTFLWHQNPIFREFVHSSPAAEAAARIMRSDAMNIVFDQYLVKEPNTTEPTVWHHDLTYWPVKGDRVATLWLALDPVTEETGSMEFVKGSHKWGRRYHPIPFGGHSVYRTDEPTVPDIDAMRDELEFIRFDYEPGDCTIHHGLSLHYAGGNQSKDLRPRAYVTRWAGDGVVYDPHPDIQRMLWDPELEPGAPLDCDLWPKVWRG